MISQEYLKTILNYDLDTGIFKWKERPLSMFKTIAAYKMWNKRYAGRKTGSKNSKGYITIKVNESSMLAHRVAWIYVHNIINDQIDHIDGSKDNNSISNLRESTQAQNNCNRNIHKNNKSGFKGVSYHKNNKRWEAFISFNGERIFIGGFTNPEDAAKAYNEHAILIHKEFSKINQQI